jgi:hypothetical protein
MTNDQEIAEIQRRLSIAGYPMLIVAAIELSGRPLHSVRAQSFEDDHKIRGISSDPMEAYREALYQARKHHAQVKGLDVSERVLRGRVSLPAG